MMSDNQSACAPNGSAPVSFFGTTRFSVYVPGSNAWVLSRGMNELEYVKHLYSDDRLAPRFDIFFNCAAPIYQSFCDRYGYRHILQYSEFMPEKWKEKLIANAAKFPGIILKSISHATGVLDVMLSSMKGRDSQTITLTRVDDDDVLSFDYIDQLQQYAAPQFHNMAVSFGFGIAAVYANGAFEDLREVRQPLLSQGQAYIGRYDAHSHKIHLPKAPSHAKVDREMPTILDSRRVAFLWAHHAGQDTRSIGERAEIREAISKKFSKLQSVSAGLDISGVFPHIKISDEK